MSEKNKNAEVLDPGRNEYRNKNDETVKKSTGELPDFSEEGIDSPIANSRDRYENAEPFMNDRENTVTKKIARNNET